MARRKRSRKRRRDSNFVVIPINAGQSLVTLADDTVLATSMITFGQDLWLISIEGTHSVRNATPGEGPLGVGFAHGALAVAEIEEALDAAPTSQDDFLANEQASRKVRHAGDFDLRVADQTLANGEKIKTRLGFKLISGAQLDLYAYNRSGGSLTTGALQSFSGKLFARWM